MNVQFSRLAWEEYLCWLARDKEVALRINAVLREIGGSEGKKTGGRERTEALRRELSGFRSRKITDADRLIYKIKDDVTLIISCMWFLN